MLNRNIVGVEAEEVRIRNHVFLMERNPESFQFHNPDHESRKTFIRNHEKRSPLPPYTLGANGYVTLVNKS